MTSIEAICNITVSEPSNAFDTIQDSYKRIPIFDIKNASNSGITRILRCMSNDSYQAIQDRRTWKKFGDAESMGPGDSVKELKPEHWILHNSDSVTVAGADVATSQVGTEVIRIGQIKCRNCGGPHLTFKCEIKKIDVAKSSGTKTPVGIYRPKFNDNFFTLKVTNLAEDDDVTKEELMIFFSKFGVVKDGYRGITMNRNKIGWTKESTINYDTLPFLGIAYVKYEGKDDTDLIVNKINQNGRHRKHNIVKCEVVPEFKK